MNKSTLLPLNYVLLLTIMVITLGCPYTSKYPLEGQVIPYDVTILGNWKNAKKELKLTRKDDKYFTVYYNDDDDYERVTVNGVGHFIMKQGAVYIVVKDNNNTDYFIAKVQDIAKDRFTVKMLDEDAMDKKSFSSASEFNSYVMSRTGVFPNETRYSRFAGTITPRSTSTNSSTTRNTNTSNTNSDTRENRVSTNSSSTKSGNYLFREVFDQTNHKWASNYTFNDSNYHYIVTLDGPNRYYYIANRTKKGYYVPLPYTLPDKYNYSYKVKVKHTDDVYKMVNNPYGIKFAASDWDNTYNFDITESGYYRISKHQNGEYSNLINWTKSEALKSGYQYNTIEVRVYTNYCTFYINDRYVTRIDNFVPFGPYLGLEVYDKQTIHFDDIEVTKL